MICCCCLLLVVWCLLIAFCCLLSVVCCLLLVDCCLLFVVCCLLFVVCCLLFVDCRLLFIVCCLLFSVCCLLFVVCCLIFARAIASGGPRTVSQNNEMSPLPACYRGSTNISKSHALEKSSATNAPNNSKQCTPSLQGPTLPTSRQAAVPETATPRLCDQRYPRSDCMHSQALKGYQDPLLVVLLLAVLPYKSPAAASGPLHMSQRRPRRRTPE